MGHWNYRVFRDKSDSAGEPVLSIREAHYGADKDVPEGWGQNPAPVMGENLEELRETLQRMLACMDKPVLDDTD